MDTNLFCCSVDELFTFSLQNLFCDLQEDCGEADTSGEGEYNSRRLHLEEVWPEGYSWSEVPKVGFSFLFIAQTTRGSTSFASALEFPYRGRLLFIAAFVLFQVDQPPLHR